MKKIPIEAIKKLREQTSAGVMDCRKALEQSEGDLAKAAKLLAEWGMEKAEKKAGRRTVQGIIHTYVHHGSRIGVMLELNCETDFVARTDDFVHLARELALQIASMDPKDVDELMQQVYIRDTMIKVGDLIKQTVAKVGENIVVRRFVRYEVGKNG